MLKSLPIVCGILFASLTCARAQAVDCDAVLHGKAPFEIEQISGGKPARMQIYRSDKLYRVQFMQGAGGKVTKATFQATFIKSLRRSDGKVETMTWSVPTDRWFWDQGVTSVETQTNGGPKETSTQKMLGEEVLNVGPCLFNTKHYAIDFGRTDGLVRMEHWFSPDLMAPLKSIVTLRHAGQSNNITVEATDIRTNFVPLQ